jgi:hypothetical protein
LGNGYNAFGNALVAHAAGARNVLVTASVDVWRNRDPNAKAIKLMTTHRSCGDQPVECAKMRYICSMESLPKQKYYNYPLYEATTTPEVIPQNILAFKVFSQITNKTTQYYKLYIHEPDNNPGTETYTSHEPVLNYPDNAILTHADYELLEDPTEFKYSQYAHIINKYDEAYEGYMSYLYFFVQRDLYQIWKDTLHTIWEAYETPAREQVNNLARHYINKLLFQEMYLFANAMFMVLIEKINKLTYLSKPAIALENNDKMQVFGTNLYESAVLLYRAYIENIDEYATTIKNKSVDYDVKLLLIPLDNNVYIAHLLSEYVIKLKPPTRMNSLTTNFPFLDSMETV